MSLILHSFDASPFGEKVRLAFGLKNLSWSAVPAEMTMPKPLLTALTGGYRKTPVLQIGADIFCDSRLILQELERRFPDPATTLYPGAHSRGVCQALAAWSDVPLHVASSGLAIAVNKTQFPPDLMADRASYFAGFMDIDTIDQDVTYLLTQLRAHAALVEAQVAAQQFFLGGDRPSVADFHAYAEIWTARAFVPAAAEALAVFPSLPAWEARVAAVGHGKRTETTAQEAIAVAKAAEPEHLELAVHKDDPLQLQAGDPVTVTPDDYGKEAVEGKLAKLTIEEVAVERETKEVGRVIVHFPRVGFRVEKIREKLRQTLDN